MSLESVCRIDVIIGKDTLSETVANDLTSINNKLLEMGIENTTGLEPSNDKKFFIEMRKNYKKLKSLNFTNLITDTETEELYVLIKESEYNVRDVLKNLRVYRRFKNKGKFQDIIQ
jgi:hypothetical protein